MTGLEDLDGDGVRDFMIGATHYGARRGYVRVYSGATQALLRIHYGVVAPSRFGAAVGQAADLDGDGVADYVVGAPDDGAGSVFAYSAASGSLLWEAQGQVDGDRFGSAVVGIGDVNGDGTPDVLGGAPRADVGGVDSGAAVLVSGLDGNPLSILSGPASARTRRK